MFKTKPLLLTFAVSSILSNSTHAAYTANVAAGSTITGETVDAYQQIIYGIANDTTVTEYGYQSIGSGGITNDTMINGGDGMVWYGGTANRTVVNGSGNNAGSFQVNGVANNTVVNSGSATINSGDNGTVDPYTGGKMNNTVVNSGGTLGNRFGVDTNTTVNAGGKLLTGTEEYGWHDTGVSEKATINNGGTQIVANGGTSKQSLVNVGGLLIVRNSQHPEAPALGDAAGTAKNTTVYGSMQNNGALDTNTIIKSGGFFTLNGTTAKSVSTNAVIENGGNASIQANSEASSWDIQGNVSLDGYNNASLNSSTINGGRLSINGGYANNVTMHDGELSNFYGTDSHTVVNGGHYYLEGYGVSNNLTINKDGYADINRGNLTDATINGVMTVANAASLSGDVKVNSSGKLTLVSGMNSLNASSTKMTVAGEVTLENQAYFNGGDAFILNEVNMSGGNIIFAQGQNVSDYSRLEIGDLSGSGTFHIEANVVDNKSDRLIVTGTSKGNHHIKVKSMGSMETTGKEVLTLVETTDGQAKFDMTNNVDLGGYQYKLRNINGTDWALYSEGKLAPAADRTLSFINTSYLLNYAETQTLLQRMGELRQSTNSNGDVWARVFTGKFDSFGGGQLSGFDMDYTGVQVGVDKLMDVNGANVYLGVMGGTSKADANYSDGNGNITGYHVGFYGSYVTTKDFYVDGTLKYSRFKNSSNITASDKTRVNSDVNSDGYGISLEVGKRFYFDSSKSGYYLEPQAQLSYAHQGSASTVVNDLRVNIDRTDSTLGRVSAVAGYEVKNGKNPVNVYFKTGYVTEMSGDASYSLNGSRENYDFGGDWWENSIGVTAQINKRHNLYLEGTYSNGSKFNQTQVNAGYRYTF